LDATKASTGSHVTFDPCVGGVRKQHALISGTISGTKGDTFSNHPACSEQTRSGKDDTDDSDMFHCYAVNVLKPDGFCKEIYGRNKNPRDRIAQSGCF